MKKWLDPLLMHHDREVHTKKKKGVVCILEPTFPLFMHHPGHSIIPDPRLVLDRSYCHCPSCMSTPTTTTTTAITGSTGGDLKGGRT
jgi:hypothetical protein